MIKSINPSSGFDRQFNKITKNNTHLKQQILDVIELLKIDPFTRILITHKVRAIVGGVKWSSRVTGDIRIIWDFNGDDVNIIDLWDLGTHSGSKKVYK